MTPDPQRIDECVVAVFATVDQAQVAIRRLTEHGFPAEQISVVTTAITDHPEVLERLKLGDDSVHNAAVGAEVGGALGMLTGACMMVVTGLGSVFLAGPLAGAIFGTVAGALIGALSGTGIHEHQLQHFEQQIKLGHVLLLANGDPLQLAHAFRLLNETDRLEVHTYAATGDETLEAE